MASNVKNTQALRVENNLLRGENASLAARCDGFSGADLQALVREAAMSALRQQFDAGQGAALL